MFMYILDYEKWLYWLKCLFGGMFYGMGMMPHKTLTKIIIMHFNIKARHKSAHFTVLL